MFRNSDHHRAVVRRECNDSEQENVDSNNFFTLKNGTQSICYVDNYRRFNSINFVALRLVSDINISSTAESNLHI